MSVVDITKENVLEKLKSLKANNSPGPNEVQPKVLKEITEEIVKTLVLNFQESLESGRVSEDRKMANVTPLFKKGGRQKTGNYRPVSLTSVLRKILESIIKDEIAEYLKMHGKIGQSQHGFVKGRSCLTNLLELFVEVMSKL
eukprot:g43486.t1